MEQSNVELSKGYREYDSKIKNIEGIFLKIQNLFDITIYKEELNKIKSDVSKDKSLDIRMGEYATMQTSYEMLSLSPYIKRLDKLTHYIEKKYMPFYEMHLLNSRINSKLDSINEENISDVINDAKKLLNLINSLNTHNDSELVRIVEKAYDSIYSVILHEATFDKDSLLAYVNYLSNQSNRENIGRLIERDLNNLSRNEIIDEELKNIKINGLGYDFLDSTFIRKIAVKVLENKALDYQNQKENTINELNDRVNKLIIEKNTLLKKYKSNNSEISNLRLRKIGIFGKKATLVLVPVVCFLAGNRIGNALSNRVDEYKTTTRVVDPYNGEVVGDVEEVYEEKETTYTATIKEYSPWMSNPSGGYIRNVVAYEYITPSNFSDGYKEVLNTFHDNSKEKYRYVESKDELLDDDSTTSYTLLITETYQNKEDSRKSKKFIIPLTIAGLILGAGIDFILIYFEYIDVERYNRILNELDRQIKAHQIDNIEIISRLNELKEDIMKEKVNYEEIVKRYGRVEETLKLDDVVAEDFELKRKKTRK